MVETRNQLLTVVDAFATFARCVNRETLEDRLRRVGVGARRREVRAASAAEAAGIGVKGHRVNFGFRHGMNLRQEAPTRKKNPSSKCGPRCESRSKVR